MSKFYNKSLFILFWLIIIIMCSNYNTVGCKTPLSSEKGDYAVWAIPSKDAVVRLHRLMDGLRLKFGGPKFDVHLTLVGPISLTKEDALEKFGAACHGLKAYPAHATEVSFGNSFWQSVFLKLDPTSKVVGVSEHFDAHFGYNRSTPYTPHMSLLYGDLTDEEKHEAVMEAKKLDHSIGNMRFSIDRLDLYITPSDKTLKSWVKVAEYRLSYTPHMSLLYGDLTDEEKHEAVMEAKKLDHSIGNMRFSIDRLDLYITPSDKTLKLWVKVAEYRLCTH